MAAINSSTIDNDARKVLEHIFADEELNPANPISPTYRPYFGFKWGERIDSCEEGRPMVAAWPDGQSDTNRGIADLERSYFIRLQVVSGGDDRTNENLFYDAMSKIKSVFGGTSIDHEFSNAFTFTNSDGTPGFTIAPFRLSDLRISTAIISSSSPRRMPGDGCRALYAEILIRWRLYLSIC